MHAGGPLELVSVEPSPAAPRQRPVVVLILPTRATRLRATSPEHRRPRRAGADPTWGTAGTAGPMTRLVTYQSPIVHASRTRTRRATGSVFPVGSAKDKLGHCHDRSPPARPFLPTPQPILSRSDLHRPKQDCGSRPVGRLLLPSRIHYVRRISG